MIPPAEPLDKKKLSQMGMTQTYRVHTKSPGMDSTDARFTILPSQLPPGDSAPACLIVDPDFLVAQIAGRIRGPGIPRMAVRPDAKTPAAGVEEPALAASTLDVRRDGLSGP